MKQIIVICCIGILLCGCSSKTEKQSRVMDCTSSMRFGADNNMTDNIYVVLHTDKMEDSRKIAEEIVERYKNNQFHSMYFSTLPNSLDATVYLDNDPILQVVYSFDTQKYVIRSLQ